MRASAVPRSAAWPVSAAMMAAARCAAQRGGEGSDRDGAGRRGGAGGRSRGVPDRPRGLQRGEWYTGYDKPSGRKFADYFGMVKSGEWLESAVPDKEVVEWGDLLVEVIGNMFDDDLDLGV